MTGSQVQVPVGKNTDNWYTLPVERTILLVAHNATTLNRIDDIVGIFQSDFRIQLTITSNFEDPFVHELRDHMTRLGIPYIHWDQAELAEFDLIISASHHGNLQALRGPIVIFSHGAGYTKYSPEEPGTRNPEPGTRNPEPGTRSVFGLSRPWLMVGSKPIAAALVLSHGEQLERLAVTVPEVLDTAVIGGDPCFDRMLESARFRRRYRSALGVDDRRDLVVLTSTWSSSSLLGTWPDLIRRLLAELPVDSFRCALIAHPNIWYGHGSGQVKAWLADCVRAGLLLISPRTGWQAAILAADVVIGDHGSATAYAAAVGRPVLLAAFPQRDVVPGTAVERMGRLAPRLHPHGSLRRQIESVIAEHRPDRYAEVTELVSAMPGASPERIRRLCYDLMRLPEPAGEPVLQPLTTAGLTPPSMPPVAAMLVSGEWLDGTVLRLERTPVDTRIFADRVPAGATTHAVVHHAHPVRGLRRTADVVFAMSDEVGGAPEAWLRETLAGHPACALAAIVSERMCRVRSRDGVDAELTAKDSSGLDTSALGSAAYVSMTDGLPPRIDVEVGTRRYEVVVRPVIPRVRRPAD